jgi:spore maturation protein CgeB
VKILYVSQLSPNDSAQYRAWALERLGHTVVTINSKDYEPAGELMRKVVHRVQAGRWVWRLNSDIIAMAELEKPDIFWADKVLGLSPMTLRRLQRMGIRTVSYMIDNAFGPRRDPGWRLYMKDIPHFDLHVVQRDKNIDDYMDRGAKDVIKIQTAYEPTIHFPPPVGWSDKDRDRGVSFIGTSYDDRPQFLTKLWRQDGLPVVISGDGMWKQRLHPIAVDALYTGGELYGAGYREGIWRSKINLSFITHSNQDEFVHKSFEIAACGGFLLAERSEGHMAKFKEDEEAVFFTGYEECVEKIKRYLPDEGARARIAAAGCARAMRDGYSNDAQVEKIVERLRPLVRGEA